MKKKLVEVSVRKDHGVIMNSFSQFHSTFIRKHSRFFVRVGHKPQSIVYKVCTYMSSGNLSFFSLSSSEKYLWIFWKSICKNFDQIFLVIKKATTFYGNNVFILQSTYYIHISGNLGTGHWLLRNQISRYLLLVVCLFV